MTHLGLEISSTMGTQSMKSNIVLCSNYRRFKKTDKVVVSLKPKPEIYSQPHVCN
jgi:hypothetical protein